MPNPIKRRRKTKDLRAMKTCRLCLKPTSKCVTIKTDDPLYENGLIEMIEQLLGSQLNDDPYYPQQICNNCLCVIHKFSRYKIMVLKSQFKLNSKKETVFKKQKDEFDDDDDDDDNIPLGFLHTAKNNCWKCKNTPCNCNEDKSKRFEGSLNEMDKDIKHSIILRYNHNKLKTSGNEQNIFSSKQTKFESEQSSIKKLPIKKCSTVCEVCGLVYKSYRQRRDHEKVHPPKAMFPCRFCSEIFIDKSVQICHEAAKHKLLLRQTVKNPTCEMFQMNKKDMRLCKICCQIFEATKEYGNHSCVTDNPETEPHYKENEIVFFDSMNGDQCVLDPSVLVKTEEPVLSSLINIKKEPLMDNYLSN